MNYFPEGVLDQNDRVAAFLAEWFSARLLAMEEPSLWELSNHRVMPVYRFLWLRTFHSPVSVRLNANDDGTATAEIKVGSGLAGFGPGQPTSQATAAIPERDTYLFLEKVRATDFWSLPTYDGQGGLDGSEWIIEGVQERKYHLVRRWTPRGGGCRVLGLAFLFELGKLEIPPDELY